MVWGNKQVSMEVGRDNRRKITPRFKSCIEAVNQTLRNEGKLRKEFYMKKLKYFSILTVCFMTLSFTLVSCDLLYDSYDYGSNDYYTPSTPSTTSTPSTPSTPTYTYYFENYSSYTVTVTIGGQTGKLSPGDVAWIDLKTPVTVVSYSPSNLVRYTGSLTDTIRFYNR